MADHFAVFSAQPSKPALLFNNALIPVLLVPGRNGAGGYVSGFEGSNGHSEASPHVTEMEFFFFPPICDLIPGILKWHERLGENYLCLGCKVLMFEIASLEEACFHYLVHLSSALRWRGQIGTGMSSPAVLCHHFPPSERAVST